MIIKISSITSLIPKIVGGKVMAMRGGRKKDKKKMARGGRKMSRGGKKRR